MNQTFIALGSNQQQPLQQVKLAVKALAELGQIKNCSSWYQSQSILDGQDDYINGVAELHTSLSALALLKALQTIENQQGRLRKERWGPRTLDLDIILFNNDEVQTPELTIPHACMLERNFVLQPLLQIKPGIYLPNGTALETISAQLGSAGLEKIS
ncbi:MAG: 2-amino-4-hydroxy-6-hydroxymethyldihydropteridine diphosphokinase [Pseudomonadales bacterium]|nr:2-amino-4-hydroxy-6-hydroxymethyldihydropteridine diphosphokinase [Pseudomonadales bacterium]